MTPLTATWPRDGSLALASTGRRTIVERPIVRTGAEKRIAREADATALTLTGGTRASERLKAGDRLAADALERFWDFFLLGTTT
jgi:hypothetical protein